MLEANVFEAFATVVVNDDVEALREVGAACCLLTLTDILRMPFVASSVMPHVVRMCGNEDVEVSRQSLGAIANAAESKRTHKRLVEVGKVVHSMVFLMRSKHLAVHREAARAASNLMSSAAAHRLFIDDGGLQSLFRLSRSLDTEVLYNAALIFRKLSPVLTNHEFIVSKGGLQPLQLLSRTQDIGVNRQAMAAMRDMASNLTYKVTMAEEGCLRRAIELARFEDLAIRILAMGTLRHLSVNTRLKRPLMTEGVLGPIFASIQDEVQDVDLLRQCSAIIGNMTENGENQVAMIKDGLLPRLSKLAWSFTPTFN